LQDKRFRYALSLGMDRSEIVQVVNLGIGEATQTGPLPTSPHYWEEQAKNMTEHDPDRANGYLDEMGLTDRDSEGYRLRPDGERLILVFEYAPTFGAWSSLAELLTAHWKQIGVDLIVKEINRQLWQERLPEIDITVWTGNGEFNPELYNDTMRAQHGAPLWNDWLTSDGQDGVEPPDFFKRQYDLSQEILVTVDPDERAKLLREILEIHMENMVVIGTTTAEPQPVIVKNSFRNVPESAVSDWNLLSPGHTYPDQYFIRQG
jgi:peptide/nickel transport system substrate-binding protein